MSADPIASRAKMPPARGMGRPRPGAIVLTRHGEPDLSRKVRLNASGYADWWARYEDVGLKPGQVAPVRLREAAKDAVILCSTRPRSVESAHALAGGRAFDTDAALIEAPLPPPNWPHWLKLAPRIWGVVARTWWWFFNHHAGQETRAQAETRAAAVADRLIGLAEDGRDVLVIAHGFFNAMVAMALRRRGWRMVENQGFRYWALRRFERR